MNKINHYAQFNIRKEVVEFSETLLASLKDRFDEIDEIAEINQGKVLKAMQDCKVSAECLQHSSGYGYNDFGRDTLEEVYAKIFHTESALVRPSITCGTHALTIALSAITRPGDVILAVSGRPYDTLEEVIGIRDSVGSLKEYGIGYDQVDLKEDFSFNFEGIGEKLLNKSVKICHIQRSKGYQTRPSLQVEDMGTVISFIKERRPDIAIMVDNCYGEFVDLIEPSDLGADLIVGSLIKNPGGGLAPIGGYIAGRKDLIEKCAFRMNAPGLGREVGASLGVLKDFYQGLFLAPTVVAASLKTAIFAAKAYEELGFEVMPKANVKRTDIIESIVFDSAEGLVAFCKGIQYAAPVDSYVTPEPWDMPGYDSKVIMAAGAFVQGSSIELSSDGPLKPPYAVFFQGGLTWPHGKLGIMKTIEQLLLDNVITNL